MFLILFAGGSTLPGGTPQEEELVGKRRSMERPLLPAGQPGDSLDTV